MRSQHKEGWRVSGWNVAMHTAEEWDLHTNILTLHRTNPDALAETADSSLIQVLNLIILDIVSETIAFLATKFGTRPIPLY